MKYEDVGHQLDTTGRRVLGNFVLSTLQRLLASAVGDTFFPRESWWPPPRIGCVGAFDFVAALTLPGNGSQMAARPPRREKGRVALGNGI